MDEIRRALEKAGLGHMEDDVLLECGLIEATVLAETIADRFKEERNGPKEHLHRVRDRPGQNGQRQNRT
jgi:hypothetical protein